MIEEIARMIALAGLGTMDGQTRLFPPNEKWTQDAWEERVLDCIPTLAAEKCRALAGQIVEFIGGTK